MNKKQLHMTFDITGLHVRETGEGEKNQTIEGYAVVFGVRSCNLTPWSNFREVYEIMEPGCIDTDLLNRSDVVLTAFHNRQIILGRWRQGQGSLSLSLDERGLKVSCTLPETERAKELLLAIERGDISGMSFAYCANGEDFENGVSNEKLPGRTADGKEVWIRHVKRCTGLYEVTIAGHPAYEQTTVEAREAIDRELDAHLGESSTFKRQREEENAQKKRDEDRKIQAMEREMERRLQVFQSFQ